MRIAAVAWLWVALGTACATSVPPPATAAGGAAAGAAVTAGAAAVIWAVGGGCRLQGCPYGSFCNRKSGFCEVRTCAQGCPEGTVCNEGLDRCQAPSPPQTPNDFLPQDDAIQNPPGTN